MIITGSAVLQRSLIFLNKMYQDDSPLRSIDIGACTDNLVYCYRS